MSIYGLEFTARVCVRADAAMSLNRASQFHKQTIGISIETVNAIVFMLLTFKDGVKSRTRRCSFPQLAS